MSPVRSSREQRRGARLHADLPHRREDLLLLVWSSSLAGLEEGGEEQGERECLLLELLPVCPIVQHASRLRSLSLSHSASPLIEEEVTDNLNLVLSSSFDSALSLRYLDSKMDGLTKEASHDERDSSYYAY